MPLESYLSSTNERVKKVKDGVGFYSKLKSSCYVLLNLIPRKARTSRVRSIISSLSSFFLRGVVLKVGGIKYALVDEASSEIISPDYEYWADEYLTPKKGDTVLDIGAHIGKYAFPLAKKVGSEGLVVAFEPIRENYLALLRGVKLNQLENIIPFNAACWNVNCKLRLFVNGSSGSNSVKRDMGQGYVEVNALSVDHALESVGIKKVDWIKIDVEAQKLKSCMEWNIH